MTSLADRVRQLAPHWAVMFAIMFLLLFLAEQVIGQLSMWQSLVIALVVAFGYPPVIRAIGFAPEIWQR